MPDNTPSALIEHGRLVELCAHLYHLALEITPDISTEDRLNRVMAAASCLSEEPDSWLNDALEQAIEQLQIAGLIRQEG